MTISISNLVFSIVLSYYFSFWGGSGYLLIIHIIIQKNMRLVYDIGQILFQCFLHTKDKMFAPMDDDHPCFLTNDYFNK